MTIGKIDAAACFMFEAKELNIAKIFKKVNNKLVNLDGSNPTEELYHLLDALTSAYDSGRAELDRTLAPLKKLAESAPISVKAFVQDLIERLEEDTTANTSMGKQMSMLNTWIKEVSKLIDLAGGLKNCDCIQCSMKQDVLAGKDLKNLLQDILRMKTPGAKPVESTKPAPTAGTLAPEIKFPRSEKTNDRLKDVERNAVGLDKLVSALLNNKELPGNFSVESDFPSGAEWIDNPIPGSEEATILNKVRSQLGEMGIDPRAVRMARAPL